MKLLFSFLFCLFFLNHARAIVVGAENTQEYLSYIHNKSIALVVNQTSRVGSSHLVDFLISKNVRVRKLFALEHGIRGDYDAGAEVTSTLDERTGLPIISMYGKNKKMKARDLVDIDIIIFDIQDIGVRFYTYISSLKYVLDACSINNKKCIVLDRPNPNANNVSGPVLDLKNRSFVGLFPIPIVYGMTIGELALMMKGEGWIKTPLDLQVVKIKKWKRKQGFKLPIKPSPNLPNQKSIELYPSLAPFEATDISVGRGTKRPFTHIGHPSFLTLEHFFTPASITGMSLKPKHQNKKCYGLDLLEVKQKEFTLKYIFDFYNQYKKNNNGKSFITSKSFFNKLIGVSYVLEELVKGTKYHTVEKLWLKDLEKFKQKREGYLIYE